MPSKDPSPSPKPSEHDGGRPIRTLDLFAGAGGLSQGFHEASDRFRSVAAVEWEPAAAATYKLNHPGTAVYAEDIEGWLESSSVPEPGTIDIVVGGPPCQGFSTLNRKSKEVRSTTNRLWEAYARTLVKVRPTYFVIENVPQFRKSAEFEQFDHEIQSGMLSDWDYSVEVLNAVDYGAPQKRKRTIVLGWFKSLDEAEQPRYPRPSSGQTHYRTVRDALQGLPTAVTQVDLPSRTCDVEGIGTFAGPFRSDELHVTRTYREISQARFRDIPEGGNRFDIDPERLAPCWVKHTSGSGDVMGRLVWDLPSVTIRTEFFKPEKGRYLHPTEHRAITHLEAARLQGFPDDYQWVGSKTAIARQIGNAVPIPFGRAIAESFLDVV